MPREFVWCVWCQCDLVECVCWQCATMVEVIDDCLCVWGGGAAALLQTHSSAGSARKSALLQDQEHNNRLHIILESLRYCLFGVKPSFKLGSNIKACKTPRNDLRSCQRHRNDLSVWHSILGYPSKTKQWGQTLDPKCIGPDLYGEMACAKFSGIVSQASERP